MTRRRFFSAAAVLVLAACSKTDAPAEPVWGKQPCVHCSMLMSDRRFGAQLLTIDGDRLFFDDVGCMVAFEERNHPRIAREWVKNSDGVDWTDARTARYASGASSPMGFGFEARSSGTSTWADLKTSVLAREEAAR